MSAVIGQSASQIDLKRFAVSGGTDIVLVDIYGLLTKCEVKAGYWPSSFFACLWTLTLSQSMNKQKRMKPIPSHLDQTSLVNKGFITWLSGTFFFVGHGK